MTAYIRATAEYSISEGKIDEFKKIAAEMIQRVEATEPNNLSYEWFLSDDNSKCHVVEIYKDSEAVMAHLGNVDELIGPLFEVTTLTRLMVYGSPSDELRQAAATFEAKIFEHWNGVTR